MPTRSQKHVLANAIWPSSFINSATAFLKAVQTTEKYLGCKQRLRQSVNDHLGIEAHS